MKLFSILTKYIQKIKKKVNKNKQSLARSLLLVLQTQFSDF